MGRFTETTWRVATVTGRREKARAVKDSYTSTDTVGGNDRQCSYGNVHKRIEVRFARSPYSVGIVPDIGFPAGSNRDVCHGRIPYGELDGRE
jgi:hypothetical protein